MIIKLSRRYGQCLRSKACLYTQASGREMKVDYLRDDNEPKPLTVVKEEEEWKFDEIGSIQFG